MNVYGLDPGEELISCCSCLVTPDGLASLSVNKDILSNTLTAFEPTSVVIKLIATPAGGTGTGTSCSQSAAFPPVQPNPNTPTLEPSLAAWRTTVHTTAFGAPAVTETPFTPATLSSGEISSLTNRCKFIIGNGSGSGICNSCRTGAFGALKLNLK